MLNRLFSCATISILASNCAHISPPSSQPSTMETGHYELIESGEPARADGLFITIPAARDILKAQRLREIDLQEQLAESQAQQQADEKKIALDQFCAHWCLPIGIIGGLIIGGGFGIWAGAKK